MLCTQADNAMGCVCVLTEVLHLMPCYSCPRKLVGRSALGRATYAELGLLIDRMCLA